MKQNCINVYVRNDFHLIDLIINQQLKDRKHNIVFKCKICKQYITKQYRRGRVIRLLCKTHSKISTFMHKYNVENAFASKIIQNKAHNTIHVHAQERKTIREQNKQNERQLKQQKKIEKIITEYGSIQNYDIYNSLRSSYEKTKFREIIKYGSHENAQRIKVEHTKESNRKRYGVEWISQTPFYKDLLIKSNRKLYGVDWYYQSDDFKKKSRDTKMRRYNDPHYRNDEQIFSTCLYRYGSISPLGNDKVRNTIAQKNIETFGVDNPWKLKSIQDKCRQKYIYQNIGFDSSPEIAFYIYHKDNNIDFEYQPNISFKYVFDNKVHKYFPDFKVGDQYFEIKGDHFFKDGKMICPFRNKDWTDEQYQYECDKYEAKHQCMLKNNIIILMNNDYKFFIDYVKQTYGNKFLNQFKNK